MKVTGKGSFLYHTSIVPAGRCRPLGTVILTGGMANFYSDLAGLSHVVGDAAGRNWSLCFLIRGYKLTMRSLQWGHFPMRLSWVVVGSRLVFKPPCLLVLGFVLIGLDVATRPSHQY